MKSRKLRFSFGLLAIVLASMGLHSCTKADVTFGNQWINNDYTKTYMIDTFTPLLSTIYSDSFPTNATGYGLIGVYNDPALGTVKASTYLQLQPPAISQGIIDSLLPASYDSAVVYLKLRHNDDGETTQNLMINVYSLTRNINYLDNTTNLYDVTSFPVNSTPLGTKTFTLNPNIGQPSNGDTLLIRLNDNFGTDLFNKYKTYSPLMQNPTDFLTYMKGLKIEGTALNNNGFIFNVADSAFIRIYYKMPSNGQRVQTYTDFKMNNNAYQFNNIQIDRSGTPLGNLNIGRGNRSIPSEATNHVSYLQQITQTAVKVTFPTVNQVKYASNFLRLVKAELLVTPTTNSFLPYYSVPSLLNAAPTGDNLNQYSETTGTSSMVYKDPITNQYTYSFDITNYINGTELPTENLTGRGIILYQQSSVYKTRVNRLIIGDVYNQLRNKGGIKLQLYYISVQ